MNIMQLFASLFSLFELVLLLLGLEFAAASIPPDFVLAVPNDLPLEYAGNGHVHGGVTLSKDGQSNFISSTNWNSNILP